MSTETTPRPYVTRPKTVEAVQYDGTNATKIRIWSQDRVRHASVGEVNALLHYMSPFGMQLVHVGDFVVRHRDGTFFNMPETTFHEHYYNLADEVAKQSDEVAKQS